MAFPAGENGTMYDIIHTSPSLLLGKMYPFRDPENSICVQYTFYGIDLISIFPLNEKVGPRNWEVYFRYGHIQGIVYGIIPCPVQSSMSCHSGLGGAFGK